MIPVHQCEDNSDAVPLYPVKGLFFKPISRIHVSVHYPHLKQSLPTGGKTVSSWEIMEKLKALLAPDKFISIRVVKNTLEFIRFEGDLENRNVMKSIMGRLDGKTLRITGFKEPMKIRLAEAKIPFPTKYDWDSFFRDAKNMNEMKPGERPDTIHLQNLPCKWFSDHPSEEKPIPSEKLFRRIWETFGDVRCIDIPLADPYRTQMQSSIAGIKTFTFSSDNVFEAYVQYKDYMNFVRAMDALRGSYILYQESSKYWVANVKVDFDKSKHLGEESIRRRRLERERLMEKEKQERMTETLSKLEEKEKSRKAIEEKKKEGDKNQAKLDFKIAMEERKYLIAQRKLEAIRLMDYLFERLKKKLKEPTRNKHKDSDLHEKIMGRYKEMQQAKVEEQHKRLKKFNKSKKRRKTSSHRESGDDSYDDDVEMRKEADRTSNRSRSRSRSVSAKREISRSRSRSPRSRSRSRSRSRGRSRSRSRSQDDHRSDSRRRHANHHTYYNRDDSHSRKGRSYTPEKDQNYDKYDHDRSRHREYHQYDGERHTRPFEYENRGRGYPRGRGSHFNRGFGDSPRRPYRGRGRGTFPSRYLGDWELHDNPHGATSQPDALYNPQEFFRGRGRGNFRGRGFHHNSHSYHNNRHESQFQRYNESGPGPGPGPGPTVHRDFTYLEQLDRAYEKYFRSITTKNDKSVDDESPGPSGS